MFSRVRDSVEALREFVRDLEPRTLDAADAARLVELFGEAERLGAAGKAIAARRVEETNAWRAGGHRSAAHWLAARAGTAISAAVDTLATARRLDDCPRTAAAFRAGELSEVQAREITQAAVADPAAEQHLLDAAGRDGLQGLRERCRAVRAAAEPDGSERYQRIHRDRHFRHWSDAEGAFCFGGRTTPDAGARLLAGIETHQERIFQAAWKAGRREPTEAYAMDALVALADGPGVAPAAVQVVVDHGALVRGHPEHGERCEIPGIGPIPVATARALATDATMTLVVKKGQDVTQVAHLGRTIPANLRRAIEARDPLCAVPGCDQRHGLEIDHRVPFALGGPASLDNLVRLCRWHHRQKHVEGYMLTGGPGTWNWQPPQHADDLAHAPP